MNTPHPLFPRALLAAAALAASTLAFAAPVYEETFESLTPGNLNGQGGFSANTSDVDVGPYTNAALGISGTGVDYVSGGVSHPGGGQAAFINGFVSNRLTNTFASQTGPVYFSLAIAMEKLEDSDFLHFAVGDASTSGSTDFDDSLGFVFRNQRRIQARIRKGTTNETMADFTGTQLPANDGLTHTGVHLLVGKIERSGGNNNSFDTISLFLDPAATTEPLANYSFTATSDTGINDLSSFGFRTGGTAPASVAIDNIRIGTTYESVVIPEPSTLILFSVGGLLGLAALRRRR